MLYEFPQYHSGLTLDFGKKPHFYTWSVRFLTLALFRLPFTLHTARDHADVLIGALNCWKERKLQLNMLKLLFWSPFFPMKLAERQWCWYPFLPAETWPKHLRPSALMRATESSTFIAISFASADRLEWGGEALGNVHLAFNNSFANMSELRPTYEGFRMLMKMLAAEKQGLCHILWDLWDLVQTTQLWRPWSPEQTDNGTRTA
jgi:hypothetical protein